MNENNLSSMRSVANVLTLVSAILETVGLAIVTIMSVGILGIVCVPLIVLIWIAYNQTKALSKGWNIYGIVQTICCADMVGLAGYILALIDLTNQERDNFVNRPPDYNPAQAELDKVKAEIAELKANMPGEKEANPNG